MVSFINTIYFIRIKQNNKTKPSCHLYKLLIIIINLSIINQLSTVNYQLSTSTVARPINHHPHRNSTRRTYHTNRPHIRIVAQRTGDGYNVANQQDNSCGD